MYILYVDVDVEPMIVRLSTFDVQQAGLEKGASVGANAGPGRDTYG